MKRGGRINPRSKRTIDRQPERDACRAAVLARAAGVCEYRDVVPEVTCGWLPGRRELEVDEILGGPYRCTEQYEPDRCKATCPRHHDWKTDHKADLLRRIGER